MIGAHDLGGKQGFGRVLQVSNANVQGEDPVEPLFHAEWERRAFALTLATGMLGQWNIDESRHARENQAPQRYLSNSYYETWLVGLQKLLHEKGMLEREELAALPFASSVEISASALNSQRSRSVIEGSNARRGSRPACEGRAHTAPRLAEAEVRGRRARKSSADDGGGSYAGTRVCTWCKRHYSCGKWCAHLP